MKYYYGILVLLVSLILAGCSSHEAVKEERLTAKDVLRRVEERNQAVRTLSGKGTISVKSPEVSNSGSFVVSMKQPDSLLLNLYGPFGIHVGTLSLTHQSFRYYNGLEDNMIEGKPDSSTLLSILHFAMPVSEILGSLAGAFPMIQDSLLRFSYTGDEYLIAYKHGNRTLEYRIDGASFLVTDYLVKDHEDRVLLQAELSQFTGSNNIQTPRSVTISFPSMRRNISLLYKAINLNENVSCSFDAPDGVKIIKK